MNTKTQNNSPALITQTNASRVIDLLGGPRVMAVKLGMMRGEKFPDAVISNWRRNGIPFWANAYISLRYRKLLKHGGVF